MFRQAGASLGISKEREQPQRGCIGEILRGEATHVGVG